jgi:pullulanase/glycogen debranching enzyme
LIHSIIIPDTFEHQPFGAQVLDGVTTFKVFSSIADSVELHLLKSYGGKTEHIIPLNHFGDGIWGIQINKNLTHWLYGYKLSIKKYQPPQVQLTNELIADPWAKHIVSRNHYLQFPLSYIAPEDTFDWEGDSFITPTDLRDLIIYEMHLKDVTGSDSTWSYSKGSYKSFIDPTSQGGINYVKKLGVNAVEFLPLQKFAHIEPSYLEATSEGSLNTWNFYGRNYWGYMTSFYFCPETSYASTASNELFDVIGKDLHARTELKNVIKSLHKEKISVILDVVYNHVSNYDLNPLKFLDKPHYFRLDHHHNYISHSGCGNDFKTESPMSRKLIIDSLKYWMTEFHVDGFRFDLASLIDWETIEEIKNELRKINPHVILIAEAWSPVNYAPTEFGNRGWAAWNDKFRNGIKGVEPIHRLGYIFGHLNDVSNKESVENYLSGSLIYRPNGLFPDSSKSINYLESHDGYTLGDFVRLSINPDKLNKPVRNKKEFIRLNDAELRVSKFAAFMLFVSQGIPMIHAGQEFARSKIIAPSPVNDPKTGFIDHDSYNKDNETNYIDFNEIEVNEELLLYYKNLIELRKKHDVFRKCTPENMHFFQTHDAHVIGYKIQSKLNGHACEYQVWINAHRDKSIELKFEKEFTILADATNASFKESKKTTHYSLPESSGLVIMVFLADNP